MRSINILFLFLASFLCFWFFQRGGYDGYELEYFLTAENIVNGNGYWMAEGYTGLPGIPSTDNSHLFPRHGYGQVLLATPLYAVGSFVQRLIPSLSLSMLGQTDSGLQVLSAGPFLAYTLLSPLLTASILVYVFLFARKFGVSDTVAYWGTWVMGFTTILFPYSVIGLEPLFALSLIATAYHWYDVPHVNLSNMWAGGIAFWFLINSKTYGIFFALVFVVIKLAFLLKTVRGQDPFRTRRLIIPVGWILFSVISFGLLLTMRESTVSGDVRSYSDYFDIRTVIPTIWALLLSSGKGFFVYSPVLLFGLIGLIYLKRPLFLWWLVGFLFTTLALFAPLQFTLTDEMWGPRYLVWLAPWLAVATIVAIEKLYRRLVWGVVIGALVAFSFLVQLPGVLYWSPLPIQIAELAGAPTMDAVVFIPTYSPVWIGLQVVASIPERWGLQSYTASNPPSYLASFNTTWNSNGSKLITGPSVNLVEIGKLVPWSLRFVERYVFNVRFAT